MAELREARTYRPPSPAERSSPELKRLYELESRIHTLTRRARHARAEAERFARDAATSKDSSQRALLEQSSAAYAALSARYRQQAAEIARERGQLVHLFSQTEPVNGNETRAGRI
jgi:uncharacterized protein YbaP (TraB family)